MGLFDKGAPVPSRGFVNARPDAGSMKVRARRTQRRTTVESLEARALLTVTAINIDAINPTEGVPFGSAGSPAQIATFDVNNYIGTDESSEYSAVVQWGDGTQSAGLGPVTIQFIAALGNGNAEYGVYSYHTYAEATTTGDPDSLTVTVDDNTGAGTSQSQSGPVSVNDAALTQFAVPTATAATVGAPLTNVTVGEFTDANPLATASGYAVQINWGDGVTSAGTVVPYLTATQSGGTSVSFAVEGSHTYATAGSYTISASVNDDAGAHVTLASPVNVAGAALLPSAGPIVVTEGATIPAGTPVGTLTDMNGAQPVADYSSSFVQFPGATAPTALTFTQNGTSNTFTLSTSAATSFTAGAIDEGLYGYTLTVSDTHGDTATTTGTLTVKDAPLSVVSTPTIAATEGTPLTGQQVLVFSDANSVAPASDFTATINWGDGLPTSVGTVTSLGGGEFSVSGAHTYASAAGSPYTVTTTVLDDGGSRVTGTATANVAPAVVASGTGVPVYGTEGQNLIGVPVATFDSDNPVASATGFTTTINWGNGNTTPGVVTEIGATATTSEFEITGSNTYLSEAGSPFNVTATVANNAGGSSLSIPTTATITQTPINVSVFPLSATAGTPTPAGQLVGTFIDAGGADPLADYTVTVNWGDGSSNTTSSGVVLTPVGANTFDITAPAHTYAQAGFYVLTVSVNDSDPATGTGAGPVVVAPASLTATGAVGGAPITTVEGQPLNNVLVATFTSSNPAAAPSDFSATINWGDGGTSAGTITQPGGPGTTFDVTGSHVYTTDGVYTITTTIAGAGRQATATSTATITEAPITVGAPIAVAGYENTPLSNVDVATFTSADSYETAATFVATINWGDGSAPTAATIVQDASGVFHVEGSHTYLTSGTFHPVITIAEQDSPSTVMGTANPTVTIASTPLLVTAAPVNATEGIALPNAQNVLNGTVVATFTDSVQSDPLSDFTATIDWGNGLVTPGTIIPTGGPNFEVIAPSTPTVTYADKGTYTVTTTVTDADSNSAPGFFQAFAISTATVKDAPLTAAPTQPVVSAFQQTPLTGVEVSAFTDGNPTAPLSDLSATIDWGDGTPASAGQIVQPGGVGTTFYVIGDHTYAQPTTPPATPDVVTVSIKDVGGSALTTTTSANVTASTITGSPVTVNGTEGQPLTNAVVAYFTDSGTPGPLSSYSATINWGTGLAGSSTIGTIVPVGGNQFAVEGSYTYPEFSPAGLPYSITVAIDHNGAAATTVVSQAQIADAPITGSAVPVYATEGQPFTGTVGVFVDADPNGTASDFTATINWGNGDSTAGTIVANGTSFLVTAADPVSGKGYAYPGEGTYSYSITVKDVGGSEFTAYQTAIVADAPLTATGLTLGVSPVVYEYPPFSGEVASFTDADPNGALSDYTATINWGDGTVSPASISLSSTTAGVFIVNGTHQYAESSQPYDAIVTIKDVGGATATADTSITISDTPLTAGAATAVTATEAQPFTAQVGTFTDANPNASPSQYTATIAWGDGQTSSGVIGKQSNGTFTVTGSHTYLDASAPGTPYAVTVSIKDVGGTAPGTATDTATATVADAPLTSQGAPINGVEGVGLNPSPSTVATFTDADPNGTASDYTATINWGDGSAPTTGTIVPTGTSPNGVTFGVTGAHTYAEEGTYQTTVTVTDAGGSKTVATGNAVIADAPLYQAATQPTVSATEGVSFTTPVAMFVDDNPSATASDFTATIDWGDGTARSTGTISSVGIFPLPGGGSVSVWEVTGSHNYIDPTVNNGTGSFPIVVNVLDKGGSSTVVTNTASLTPATLTLTGQLNPATDTGESDTDAVTKDDTPQFVGTTEPYATVRLYAALVGTNNYVQVGSGEANAAGAWSITTSVLADGVYNVWANAVNRSGAGFTQTQILPNGTQGDLVIDTVGPTVDNVSFDRANGTIDVTFGDNLSGLDLASITDANSYSLTRPGTPAGTFLVTGISTPVAGPNPGQESVVLTINDGTLIKGGYNFSFGIHSEGPSYPNGVQDVAGNALSGTFYGSFPSGTSVPGGDFNAQLAAFHDRVLAPATRVGTVSPVAATTPTGTTKRAARHAAVEEAHAVHDAALAAVVVKKQERHGH